MDLDLENRRGARNRSLQYINRESIVEKIGLRSEVNYYQKTSRENVADFGNNTPPLNLSSPQMEPKMVKSPENQKENKSEGSATMNSKAIQM